jgi:hypothetical protein
MKSGRKKWLSATETSYVAKKMEAGATFAKGFSPSCACMDPSGFAPCLPPSVTAVTYIQEVNAAS